LTRLFNDPDAFQDESAAGLALAHSAWLRRVPGGVVRSTREHSPQVALVVGGGSGHYPAFAGLVGPGLAHGAAMGNLFASPSASQVQSVATAANQGEGVLLSYGNYAGDVLNFDEAQERLRVSGIRCETVVVTDDVSSAPPAERHKRRGIAGDLTVFKVAGAAAAAGATLDEVVAIAQRANDRTRSFGVAFSGCTLPGAPSPLFSVPEGRMAVGMGIHGEPGIDETDVPSAVGLASLLVSTLLAEVPSEVGPVAGARAAVILNGLGSVKYEELFVVYGRVHTLLAEAGIEIVEPEVGELVTSFDMAGVSLTLFWLDEELERLWRAPADTPAFRKAGALAPAAAGGATSAATAATSASRSATRAAAPAEASHTVAGAFREEENDTTPSTGVRDTLLLPNEQPEADDASQAAARVVLELVRSTAECIDENATELGRVDAVAGDGDHGIGMQRGVHAALAAAAAEVESGSGAASTLRAAGEAWAARAGGTSGALWGAALRAAATHLGDQGTPDAQTAAAAVSDAAAAIVRLGKAELGDKTMVDVLLPFAEAFTAASTADATRADAVATSHPGAAGAGVVAPAAAAGATGSAADALAPHATAIVALAAAVPVAERAAAATAELLPRIGRARPHAEKSLGTPDAGALSLSLILRAALDTLEASAATVPAGAHEPTH
jgi:dihydroxyacetone kinase